MVHPKNSCDKLMHPAVLKIGNEAKKHIKINTQKDSRTTGTVCTKNNTRQRTQQIQKIIFIDIFAVTY